MKRHAPATSRNSAAIADVLERELPQAGCVLEIASGTGEHAVFMARRYPDIIWQPSDLSGDALASVDAYAEQAALSNLRPAIELDAASRLWPIASAQAIVCINMTHIAPLAATVGLVEGAGRILPDGAPLVLYGPFIEPGVDTAVSNKDFDASLKARNADWGLRSTAWLDSLAAKSGLIRTARHEMPANNLTLVWRRQQNARR